MNTEKTYRYFNNLITGLRYRVSSDSIEVNKYGGGWEPSAHTFETFERDQSQFEETDKDGRALPTKANKKPLTVPQVFRLLTRSGRRNSLGIAEYLHRLKITGKPGWECDCPVANFFKLFDIQAKVLDNAVLVDGKAWDIPEAVRFFISDFDDRFYPALIA